MKKILIFSLLFMASSHVFAVPIIIKSISSASTFKFTETLSEKLLKGHKVKIDINNGKGLVAMNCSALICTLSTNTLPKNVDSVPYKVGIYDSKGFLQGSVLNGNYIISNLVSLVPVIPTTTIYQKISNAGNILPDTAKLGMELADWACTKDSKTGLTWEVKTSDGGLRDMNLGYMNYLKDDTNYGVSTNSDVFVNAVNKETLCGGANWRLPTHEELKALIVCSDGKYDKDGACTNFDTVSHPSINTTYFPNTQGDLFWSSTPNIAGSNYVWGVYFYNGFSDYFFKNYPYSVRLVHS